MIYIRIIPYDRLNFISLRLEIFHSFTLFFRIVILSIIILNVFMRLNTLNSNLSYKLYKIHNLEFFWTIYPIVLLLRICIPSFYLLYILEKNTQYVLTIKTIRHQWYWSYECSDFGEIRFESYIIDSLERFLSVDNSLVLPYNNKIRIIINSFDVLHSWTIPSLYIKVDAVPRRLNSILINNNYPRSYFRQCSEICRTNHSFIPIHVEFINWKNFINWYIKITQ